VSGLAVVVLAAGKGKRFHSDLPKVLHRVAGVPLLHWVLGAVEGIGDVDRILVVVGHGREAVAESVSARFTGAELVDQPEQRGTGDAVARCRAPLEGFTGDILVLPGDAPLVEAGSLRALVAEHRRRRAAVSLLTAVLPDPAGYGRITRDPDGTVRIVEHADASLEVRAIREVSTGIWCFDAGALFPALEGLSPDNVQGELYLPDAAPVIQAGGGRMVTVAAGDPETVRGVNDQTQLAQAERALQARIGPIGPEKESVAPPS
jgi:bifunctional UDP-N-acetylglucosamine pyrophosphorylase/glucosamine-1-phosphate N-acetyltransferase